MSVLGLTFVFNFVLGCGFYTGGPRVLRAYVRLRSVYATVIIGERAAGFRFFGFISVGLDFNGCIRFTLFRVRQNGVLNGKRVVLVGGGLSVGRVLWVVFVSRLVFILRR